MRHVLEGSNYSINFDTSPIISFATVSRHGLHCMTVVITRYHKDQHSHIKARRYLLRKVGAKFGPIFRRTMWAAAIKDPGILPPKGKSDYATLSEFRNLRDSEF